VQPPNTGKLMHGSASRQPVLSRMLFNVATERSKRKQKIAVQAFPQHDKPRLHEPTVCECSLSVGQTDAVRGESGEQIGEEPLPVPRSPLR